MLQYVISSKTDIKSLFVDVANNEVNNCKPDDNHSGLLHGVIINVCKN
jgi:hypothetical protein